MRVIWLRKKVVEYDPPVQERGLVVYHGTTLPNLYRILKSGKLGSEVGRHTGFYRRVGTFYMTDDERRAEDYAGDAARDPTYYVPKHSLPYIETVKENASSLQNLMEVFEATDTYDLYVKFASLLRHFGFYGGSVYPPVVIKLVIRQPEVLDRVYFDEDLFAVWLGEHLTDAEIVGAAMQDPEFREWVLEICPRCKLPPTPGKLVWKLSRISYGEGEATPEEEEENPLHVTPLFLLEQKHEVAKRIYDALIRLTATGQDNGAARRILEQFKRDWESRKAYFGTPEMAWSYFIQDYTPLESIDEATATIYLDTGTIEINLKDAGALQQVEDIMRDQILDWASILR
jgi:hypothetical protein